MLCPSYKIFLIWKKICTNKYKKKNYFLNIIVDRRSVDLAAYTHRTNFDDRDAFQTVIFLFTDKPTQFIDYNNFIN